LRNLRTSTAKGDCHSQVVDATIAEKPDSFRDNNITESNIDKVERRGLKKMDCARNSLKSAIMHAHQLYDILPERRSS
jgi:hypothetical protein